MTFEVCARTVPPVSRPMIRRVRRHARFHSLDAARPRIVFLVIGRFRLRIRSTHVRRIVHLLPKREQADREMLQLVRAAHQPIRELLHALGLRSACAHHPGFERSTTQLRITREERARKLAFLDDFSDDLLDSIRGDHARLRSLRRAGSLTANRLHVRYTP